MPSKAFGGIAWVLVIAVPSLGHAEVVLEPLPRFELTTLGEGRDLELADVLDSVARHHPAIAAADARARGASGTRMAAEGAFDPTLSATGFAAPVGYYRYGRADVSLSQPTPFWGTSFLLGWRIGRGADGGEIPDYYGFYETLDGGELRVGATVPLWRDGAIDARRATWQRAELGEDAAQWDRDARVLRLQLAATEAYYRWVAAGLRLEVAHALLELGDARDEQIARRVAAGAIASFEHLDNRRAVLERRYAVVVATRALERTAIQLSLFLRNGERAPRVPSADEVPETIVVLPVGRETEPALILRALQARPELARFAALSERARIDVDLAENQIAPRIDVTALGAFDVGGGAASSSDQNRLGSPVLETSIQFSLPLGMREGRGRAAAATEELVATMHEQQFFADQITAEVRDAVSALDAATRALDIVSHAEEVAEAVAQGERARFDEGATTLLVVNLRETAAASASSQRIDAQAEFAIAHASLRIATGTLTED